MAGTKMVAISSEGQRGTDFPPPPSPLRVQKHWCLASFTWPSNGTSSLTLSGPPLTLGSWQGFPYSLEIP